MNNASTELDAVLTRTYADLWLVALVGLAWVVVAYFLNKRGFFLRPWSALGGGILFIVTLYVASIWQAQQGIVLLIIPALLYLFNEYVLRSTNNLKEVVFIAKNGLKYGEIFIRKLSEDIKADGLVLHTIYIGEDNGQTLSVNEAISRGPLAIVLVPTDDDKTTVANVKAAYSAHVPVVLVDKKIDDRAFELQGVSAPAYVGSDFERGGAFAADALDVAIGGKGNIAIIAGPQDSVPSQARLRAFAERALERAPNVLIRYCTYCLSWDADEGASAATRAIRRFNEDKTRLDGIFCCNDSLAIGAVEALETAYQKGILPRHSVKVVGYDGLPEMVEYISSGRADATVDVQISIQATAVRREILNIRENIRDHIVKSQARHIAPVKVIRTPDRSASAAVASEPTNASAAPGQPSKIYDAVLFDMDGLMIDNEDAQLKSFNTVLKPFGISLSERDFIKFVGTSQREIFLLLTEGREDVPSIDELMKQKKQVYFPILEREFKVAHGLGKLMDYLNSRDVLLGVVSSSPLQDIKNITKDLGLTNLDIILSALEVKRAKPFGDVYEKAARELRVNPADCLVLEDSDKGLQSARSAGMDCFVVPNKYTRSQDLSAATRSFASLSDVEEWLRENRALRSRT